MPPARVVIAAKQKCRCETQRSANFDVKLRDRRHRERMRPGWRISTVCIYLRRTAHPVVRYSARMTFESAKVGEIGAVFEGWNEDKTNVYEKKYSWKLNIGHRAYLSSWAWKVCHAHCYLFFKKVLQNFVNGSIWKVMVFSKWPKKRAGFKEELFSPKIFYASLNYISFHCFIKFGTDLTKKYDFLLTIVLNNGKIIHYMAPL